MCSASLIPAAVTVAPNLQPAAYVANISSGPQLPQGRPSSTVPRAANGMFYVEGFANSKPINFLIDTGASHVILSKSDAKRLGTLISSTEGHSSLSTASGQTQVEWVIIKELEIGGRRLKQVRAAVPQQDPGMSLLGQNVLAQFATVHIEGDQLTMEF
jgi:aspartyl protease family protein